MRPSSGVDRHQRRLDVVKSPKQSPFVAPAFWLGLWEPEGRRVVFGGFEDVLRPVTDDEDESVIRSPCPLEDKLHAAVASIRLPMEWSDRWTDSIGGWRGFIDGQPRAHIVDLIEGAHPMPVTFQAAFDEYAYWVWRTYMAAMCVAYDGETPLGVLADPNPGNLSLDLTVLVRLERIRPLLLHGLATRSIAEVVARLRISEQMIDKDPQIEAAVLRDLAAILDDKAILDDEANACVERRRRGSTDPSTPRGQRSLTLPPGSKKREPVVAPAAHQAPSPEAVVSLPQPLPKTQRTSRGRATRRQPSGAQIDWVEVMTGYARP